MASTTDFDYSADSLLLMNYHCHLFGTGVVQIYDPLGPTAVFGD